jgi:flavin reductase
MMCRRDGADDLASGEVIINQDSCQRLACRGFAVEKRRMFWALPTGELIFRRRSASLEVRCRWALAHIDESRVENEVLRMSELPELSRNFREAMRRLAATVNVVTARNGDRCLGMTATAVTSLSMDPVSALVCVNRTAEIHGILVEGAPFRINLLAARTDHEQISGVFSHPLLKGHERFQTGDWDIEAEGGPRLRDARASLLCIVGGRLDYGTHTVIAGKITDVELGPEAQTLVYYDGRYATA